MAGIKLNWRIVLGCIIIVAALAELKNAVGQYWSHETHRYEMGIGDIVGIGLGFLALVAAGYYLISTGRKNQREI